MAQATDESSYRHDVFLSFAPADEDFALGVVAAALRESGARVHHAGEFTPGAAILEELAEALESSRYVVVVLSPEYLVDRMGQFERVAAQHLTMEDAERRLIPILRQPTPTPDLLIRVLVHLDFTDPDGWGRELVRLCETVGKPPPQPTAPPDCPYPGMVPFGTEQKEFFFGRTEETTAVVRRLRVEGRLLIVGPSGSGKSSLALAGVIPALEANTAGQDKWAWRVLRPGADPLASLAAALGTDGADPSAAVTAILGEEQADQLLLVVDQLEELFTLGSTRARDFATMVESLLRVDGCSVLATMRADFYEELMVSQLWSVFEANRLEVLPLDADRLRDAIRLPALEQEVYVEAALVQKLVDDAGAEPGMLPFIQETLHDLWQHVEWRLLPLTAYVIPRHAYGEPPRTGLHAAIETHANAALSGLESDEERMIARRIFLRLVQRAEGRGHVRRQRTLRELEQVHPDRRAVSATVGHLVDARLLTSTSAEESDVRKIDLAHEALIAGWPELQKWIDESAEGERRRARLADQADEWERLERRGGVLDAIEVADASRWMASRDAEQVGVDAHIREYVTASIAALEAEQRAEEAARNRQLTVTRRWLVAVAALAALFLVAAVYAYDQQQRTETARGETKAVEIAVVSSQLADQSLDRALLLAVESYLRHPTEEATASLVTTLGRLPALERILRGHDAEVRAVAVSPNGSVLASAGRDHRIILWNSDGTLMRTLEGHTDDVQGLAFSPDGTILVSSSDDLTVRRWDIPSGSPVGVPMEGHTEAIRGVAVDPSNRWVATAAHDATVRIWDRQTGAAVQVLAGPTGLGLDVAFSADGDLLAAAGSVAISGGGGGELIVYRTSDFKPIRSDLFDFPVRAVAFNPERTTELAVALNDGSIAVVDTATSATSELKAHSERVFDVAFSRDGSSLASAGRDHRVVLYDVDGDGLTVAEAWSGHAGDVRSIAFAPDGRVVTGSRDRSVMVWNPKADHRMAGRLVAPGRVVLVLGLDNGGFAWVTTAIDGSSEIVVGNPNSAVSAPFEQSVTALAYSPERSQIAIGFSDGMVSILDASTLEEEASPFADHDEAVTAAAFSPDGSRLATADDAGEVLVRESESGDVVADSGPREFAAVDVLFTDDGPRLFVTDANGTLWIGDTGSSDLALEVMADNRVRARNLAVAEAGDLLAVGTGQDQIQLWDVGQTPPSVASVIDHDGDVRAVSVDETGRLAALSTEATVGVWGLDSGRSLGSVPALGGLDVALAADGNTLAIATATGLVVWDLDVQSMLEVACQIANRELTGAEWDFYVGGEYRATCAELSGIDDP